VTSELERGLSGLLPADALGRAEAPVAASSPEERLRPLALPATVEQAAAVLALCERTGARVLPLGLGTKLGWCPPARDVDLLLSTRRLEGVVEYESGDGTLTARAGARVADLAAAVRSGGHRFVPDVPRPDRATLGGVLAAGQSGFGRLRFGPARHQLLGASVLLADGTLARSGGRLVKNVTGYDLHRLYAGSHGSLCVIVEASLRLYPLPEHRVLATVRRATLSDALAVAAAAAAPALRPTAVRVDSTPEGWRTSVALDGREAVVEAELRALQGAVPELEVLRGSAAEAETARLRDDERAADDGPFCAIGVRPSRATELLSAARAAAAPAAEAEGTALSWSLHPGVATVLVRASASPGPRLRRALADAARPLGGELAWRSPPGEPPPAGCAPPPVPPAALATMRALERALDPAGRFALGRLHAEL